MAGSLRHIVDEDGHFTTALLDACYRDSAEALRECFNIIRVLSVGDRKKVNRACKRLGYLGIDVGMKAGR